MQQSPYNYAASINNNFSVSTARPECVQHIAHAFRRRCVLPEVTGEEELGQDLPNLREALLFRPWALLSPPKLDRTHVHWGQSGHELFDEERVRYPFEDELFWKGDEEELGMS